MRTEKFYGANDARYDQMIYRRCGHSGLLLPAISLGLWHNFGFQTPYEQVKEIIFHSFDQGITHFDLANNYGPPAGSAEENFGRILSAHLGKYRDEIIVSTKAGYLMWPGPYGEWGSKKYLISSLDQSLCRMKLDYVDIFYSHRFDPNTPLEETMSALELVVKQGKALYVGISSYSAEMTRAAEKILKAKGIRCLIHQPSYSMFNRWVEQDLLLTLKQMGVGCIAFSPLAQGVLSDKYLGEIPQDSRYHYSKSLQKMHVREEVLEKVKALNQIALRRGQSLAQMAIAWVLRRKEITSALIGVSRLEQLQDSLKALKKLDFSPEELEEIDRYAVDSEINIWRKSSEYK